MRLELVQGDITEQRVDAIVNAANSSLFGGGGVDGAIHKRGGRQILAECRTLRDTRFPDGLPVGGAVATTAGKLKAQWVIHTVGPIYGRGTAEQLRACYLSALGVASELGAQTVALPLISAGAYGWPVRDAIGQAVSAIESFTGPGVARLVLFSDVVFAAAVQHVGAGRSEEP
ncbi:MAG: O-acetyl-ADP-ribose deacetylase [Pseudonocardiales bacterium]|nr:O-acetyl-ADP-ribose deacetylase [Pseudonocardiales bacterium]